MRRPATIALPGAAITLAFAVLLISGCTRPSEPPPEPTALATSSSSNPAPTPTPPTPTSAAPSPTPAPSTAPSSTAPRPNPVRFDADRALRDIRRLATDIGPREATSKNFAEAADLVEKRFEDLGFDVRRTRVDVPAGNSWGTPVRNGRSANVIAEPAGFDSTKPHLVVGAHLDTVPVAPGAEDNASGVSVLLELARLASLERPDLPVQLIAFGAEEPRGDGDALHHFGSTQFVADLSRAERRAIRGMVALDRVGVRASYVPVCRANNGGTELRDAVRDRARELDITSRSCASTTSDHWSYAKVGVPAIRLGSVPYAGYHSQGDVFSVVDRRQLDRVGRVMWAWLQDPG
jgi:hypothetical protein